MLTLYFSNTTGVLGAKVLVLLQNVQHLDLYLLNLMLVMTQVCTDKDQPTVLVVSFQGLQSQPDGVDGKMACPHVGRGCRHSRHHLKVRMVEEVFAKEGGCEFYSKYIDENCFNCFLQIK